MYDGVLQGLATWRVPAIMLLSTLKLGKTAMSHLTGQKTSSAALNKTNRAAHLATCKQNFL